jgi:hypothetical protein
MTDLIRINDSTPQWPYSEGQLRIDEPRLSLSYELPNRELASLSSLDPPVLVYRKVQVDPPTVDPRTERLAEVHPVEIDGVWTQQWEVTAATEEEIAAWDAANAPQPDYIAFYDATLTSLIYEELYQYANVSLPMNTALTAFIAAFDDAKAGRANVNAIQACIFRVLQVAPETLTAEHLSELQELMTTHHLAAVYTLSQP